MAFTPKFSPLEIYIDLVNRSSKEFKNDVQIIRKEYFKLLKENNLDSCLDDLCRKFFIPINKEAYRLILLLIHTDDLLAAPVQIYDYTIANEKFPLSLMVDQPSVLIQITGPIGEEEWREIWPKMTKKTRKPLTSVRFTSDTTVEFSSNRKGRIHPDMDLKFELYRLEQGGMTLEQIVGYISDQKKEGNLKYKAGFTYTADEVREKINSLKALLKSIQ